jgi:chemotaxis methyl-accepting protein methylase
MRACGVGSLREYAALLEANPDEADHLLDALTINVTRFFRNAPSWWRLAELLPPPRPGGQFRAWSAGCATGEEAYTLAMLLADRQGEAFTVDASDVDPACLRTGSEGRYGQATFQETPAPMLERWTEADGDGRRVIEQLRGRVRWKRHDLGTDSPPHPPYDLIACRNVVIYFTREAQDGLYHRLADALRPGGLLLLGKVELPVGTARARFQAVDLRERIYRRTDER